MKKMSPYFADIHLHPNLKSFNSGRPPRRNIWEFFEHSLGSSNPAKFVHDRSPELAKYAQANLDAMAEGKLRVATVSLYPTEKGFTDLRNLPKIMTNKKAREEMLEVITGYERDSIQYIQKNKRYFEDLNDEYRYIYDNQGKSPDKKKFYKVVNNYNELQKVLETDNGLALIMAVEGGHALFNEKMLSGKLSPDEMKKELTQNILKIKSWEAPPFTMNLCHHFYNQLCGHARSFSGLLSFGFVNQNKGLESGLTGLGIKAMKELLSNNNGKRILIDTKHMGLSGRKEFYHWIRSFNHLTKSDKIPVICSHGGVNGYKTMSGSLQKPDNAAKNKKSRFNRWSINVSDEEIRIVHETEGLIGIMLDKYKLGGDKFFDDFKKLPDEASRREAYAHIIMDNALQMVHAVGNKSGWDVVCLGSDLDGAINHVDYYNTVAKFPELWNDLYSFLDRTKHGKEYWYGYKPEEIVDKILRKNVMDFYAKFFV